MAAPDATVPAALGPTAGDSGGSLADPGAEAAHQVAGGHHATSRGVGETIWNKWLHQQLDL